MKAGFTLIEVLLVTALLSLLGLATFQSMRASSGLKTKVDFETESLQEARAVFALLDRDIRAAHFLTPEELVWDTRLLKLEPNQAPPLRPLPVTVFKGSKDDIFFSAKSHQRLSANAPENEFHFVTYQLQKSQLVRGESFRATSLKDRENPDGFRTFVLLEKVKSMTFSFYDPRSDAWSETWDTERDEFRDRLPNAVKFIIEYEPEIDVPGNFEVKTVKISTSVSVSEAGLKSLLGVPGVGADNP